ncbi:MAG TPA: ribonuclease III [Actinomycetota bacterium]|nr:ribonuclease III [Actinomycetota bacterium]
MAITQAARPSRRSRAPIGLSALGVPEAGGPLYDLALTHRSFAFEHGGAEHNERLEFLGDAILGAIVTDLIFATYPELSEGAMAPLRASVVNMHSLAEIARDLGIGEHIRLGKGEEMGGGRDKDSLLADAFEALIGAVYLDRGIDAARAALVPIFRERTARAVAAGNRFDPKAALQERVVRDGHALPSYRVTGSGPDHDKRFEADVFVAGELVGSGRGRSKKEAEQRAARQALAHLDNEPEGRPRPDSNMNGGAADARAS